MRFAAFAASLALLAAPAGAQTFSTLYSFTTPSEFSFPESGLAFDQSGNLVGTRSTGGAFGLGTVFRLSDNGAGGYTYSTLIDFNGTNGSNPRAGVIMDAAGNIFGTTAFGGTSSRGTVFRLSDNGVGGYDHSVLFNFTATTATGRAPAATLMADAAGNLYGTTGGGGTAVAGTIFRLASDGGGTYTHSTLHNFTLSQAGLNRRSGLVGDAAGNFYGTTEVGGSGSGGTVYRLSPNGAGGYTYSIVANLTTTTGRFALGGLIADANGNLYGTAFADGASGNGTVFRLTDNGAGGFSTAAVHNFDYTNGANPVGGLIADAVGNLFGTTNGGGGPTAPGTIFRLSDNGAGGYTHTVLYTFDGTTGAKPYGDLIADDEGNLYGMAQFGGDSNNGIVFRIASAGFVVAEAASTPEPATLALFGVALAALAARPRPRAA